MNVDERTFPSSEHLFQYRMASLYGQDKLAEDILLAESPSKARHLAKGLPKDRELELAAMREVVKIKAEQCPLFVLKLQRSGGQRLLENTRDEFWGKGLGGKGDNQMGRLLMELRDSLHTLTTKGRDYSPPHVPKSDKVKHSAPQNAPTASYTSREGNSGQNPIGISYHTPTPCLVTHPIRSITTTRHTDDHEHYRNAAQAEAGFPYANDPAPVSEQFHRLPDSTSQGQERPAFTAVSATHSHNLHHMDHPVWQELPNHTRYGTGYSIPQPSYPISSPMQHSAYA